MSHRFPPRWWPQFPVICPRSHIHQAPYSTRAAKD
nr:MAG TPA: hypothetical protein [Caudoviricetes sp.]